VVLIALDLQLPVQSAFITTKSCIPISSTNKTARRDITEILFNVALKKLS
jgi:hypothetical protein